MFLQIMPFAADISGDFVAIDETDTGDFSQGGIRFFGRRGINAQTNAPPLGAVFQRRGCCFIFLQHPRPSCQLINSRHRFFASFFLLFCAQRKPSAASFLNKNSIITRNPAPLSTKICKYSRESDFFFAPPKIPPRRPQTGGERGNGNSIAFGGGQGENFHHLVAVMINYFNGDFAAGGGGKRAADGCAHCLPCFRGDFRFQCPL